MQNNYRQIKFTGDIFRVSYRQRPTQDGNIKWLYHALKNPLELATSLPIEMELYSKEDISLVSSGYRMIGENISMEAWPRLFYHDDLSEEFLQQVWLSFRNSIVVAFELPELLKSALDRLNIPYIDIIIHPVRFLDDLVFGIRSNSREVAELLHTYLVPDETILIQAGLVIASMNRLKRLKIPGKAAFFAGQTTDDKVLINQGKFHNVSDFLEQFEKIAASYDTIVIKSHPYTRDPFEAISISRLFNNCITVTDNFYYLMSHDNIEAVYSISSSTSIEARYLGKKGYHLANYPFKFTEDFNEAEFQLGSFFTIDDVIFSADFWRKILTPLVSTTPTTGIKLPKKPNRIRTSLRSFWGFNFVDTDIICQLHGK